MSCTNLTSKISPISSGINKHLLTPCRRIGLSRKRKTPSSIVKISSEDLNSSNDFSLETTPIIHRKSLKRKTSLIDFQTMSLTEDPKLQIDTKINTEELLDCIDNVIVKRSSKKKILQTFSSEEIFICNDVPSVEINLENSSLKLSTKVSVDESMNSADSISDTHNILKNSLSKSLTKTVSNDLLDVKRLSLRDEVTIQKTPEKLDYNNEVMIVSDSDEDFKTVSKYSHKQKRQIIERKNTEFKRIKRSLSIKKSLSATDNEFDTVEKTDKIRDCKVELQQLNETEAYFSKNVEEISDKSFKKSVEDPIIVDDDDDFTSTPDQERTKKKNMLHKIKELQNQINQKHQHLANLKQASIYKNIHNIESIRLLTSKWISGCVLGLNDLLDQLQAHGPMNMATLLSNLHIPNEIVSKLSLNVD